MKVNTERIREDGTDLRGEKDQFVLHVWCESTCEKPPVCPNIHELFNTWKKAKVMMLYWQEENDALTREVWTENTGIVDHVIPNPLDFGDACYVLQKPRQISTDDHAVVPLEMNRFIRVL